MEEDQFNEFEQADQPHAPISPESVGQVRPVEQHLAVTFQSTFSPQHPTSIHAPSLLTNHYPQSQPDELEEKGWGGSAWPNLNKIQSDHLATVQPIFLGFGKTNSQTQHKNQFLGYGDGLLLSTADPYASNPNIVASDPGNNFQHLVNLKTNEQSNSFNGMDFGNTEVVGKKQGNLMFGQHFNGIQGSVGNKQTVHQQFIVNGNSALGDFGFAAIGVQLSPSKESEQPRKQSEQFVFEQQNKQQQNAFNNQPQITQASKISTHFQKHQEPFIFQDTYTNTNTMNISNQVAPNNIQDNLQTQTIPSNTTVLQQQKPLIYQQSQPFPFTQSQSQPLPPTEPAPSTQPQQLYPPQSGLLPQQLSKVEQSLTQPQQAKRVIQQAHSEQVKPQVQSAAEQQQQFGQFQQNVAVGNPVSEQTAPAINSIGNQPNIVQVQQTHLPLEVDGRIREQQLQQLVDSLPDYRFLLVEGFNSL